jgi:hypothetical protein
MPNYVKDLLELEFDGGAYVRALIEEIFSEGTTRVGSAYGGASAHDEEGNIKDPLASGGRLASKFH